MTDAPPDGARPGVAILLAAAAIAAALIGLQTARLSSQAAEERQRASVDEVVNSFLVSESIRYVFEVQLPLAMEHREAQFLAIELIAESERTTGVEAEELAAEAGTQASLAESLAALNDAGLAGDAYRAPTGLFDLGQRLADDMAGDEIRSPNAAARRAGDLDGKALAVAIALVPAALALGCGSLAQVSRRRRGLLVAGWVALAAGAVTALAGGALS